MLKPAVALSALAFSVLAVAQYPGTSPIVSKKPADKRATFAASPRLDTRSFSPQIKEVTGQIPPREIENEFNHLVFNTTEQNTIQLGGVLPTPSPIKSNSLFPAIGATGWTPPDPDVAVEIGRAHV